MRKNKLHYAWIVAAALFCLQGGIYGVLMNCRGMFHTPVCETFGFLLGDFTIYTTAYGIAAVLAVPVATKVVPKCNLPVLATFCSVIIAGGQFMQGYFTQLWQWYIVAALQGACSIFVYTFTVGVIVNNWFFERKGLVMSLVSTASGLFGAVLNIVCNNIIDDLGWQSAYHVLGIILFVVMVPSSMVLRLKPADMGLLPYGYKASDDGDRKLPPATGVPAKAANRSLAMWLFLIPVGTIPMLTCYSQYNKDYAQFLGFSSDTAAALVAISLVGNLVMKLVVGVLTDKFGFRKAQTIILGFVMAAFVFLCFNNIITLYIASFLLGASMAAANPMNPLWVRTLFGDYDYVSIYSKATLTNSLVGALGFTVCGYIISAFGYRVFIIFGVALAAATYVIAMLSHVFAKRLTWETREDN